ncbi:hypothetical protein H4S04_008812, partial [Coemansia sp. S16]
HIGGDLGKKDIVSCALLGNMDWTYSISARQYHEDIGSAWRTAEMNRLIDRLGLRLWMSKMRTSNAMTPEDMLIMLRYLYKTDSFVKHMEMHQKLRVRVMNWRAYEQKASTIAKYCRDITAGFDRDSTTIDMGDAKLHNMRGCLPSPRVKKLVDCWRRMGWHVVMIKEANTSQVCSSCTTRLPTGQAPVKLCKLGDEHTKHRFMARPSNNHFVKHCSVCGIVWNRDVNAARNMAYLGYLLAMGLPRPWYFVKHLEHPPVHRQVLHRPVVPHNSLTSDDLAPYASCRSAPVYRRVIGSDGDSEGFEPVYHTHRVRHYAHITQPTPRPARQLNPRFEHPLPRRSLPQDDKGPFPACIRRDPRPPKPQNERPRWMPTAVRAGQLRQAAKAREASRLATEPNPLVGPGPAALRRRAVNSKRAERDRVVLVALYESASG